MDTIYKVAGENSTPLGLDVARPAKSVAKRRAATIKKFLVGLDPQQVDEIGRYQHAKRLASRSEAIRVLVGIGLKAKK